MLAHVNADPVAYRGDYSSYPDADARSALAKLDLTGGTDAYERGCDECGAAPTRPCEWSCTGATEEFGEPTDG